MKFRKYSEFSVNGCYVHLRIVHQTDGPAWMNHLMKGDNVISELSRNFHYSIGIHIPHLILNLRIDANLNIGPNLQVNRSGVID